MREYELVLVAQPELEDEGVSDLVAQVTSLITQQGGQVTRVGQLADRSGKIAPPENWKRRKFAYPIRKFREGYYAIFRLQAEAPALTELERWLRLSEDVLRYLLVRTEEHAATAQAEPAES